MIIIDDSTPRWIRELDRFIHLKSLLFVHGNVLDRVSYPVAATKDKRYWTETDLSSFFQRYLLGLGYEIVASFDPVDGLSFATAPMETLHRQVLDDKINEDTRQQVQQAQSAAPIQRPPTPSGLPDPEPIVRDMAQVLHNREVPCAFVLHFTSRLLSSPDRLSRQEQALFTRLLKASLDSREILREDQRWNNVLILVCDKLNDLPAFLYINNPRTHSIQVDKPTASDRIRFFNSKYPSFHGASGKAPHSDLVALFSVLTDGLSYYELLSLIGLSLREQIPVEQIRTLCERFKYGITESDWDKLDAHRLQQAGELIRSRIKGQENAVAWVLQIVKRAKLGLAAGSRKSQRPRGVMFFAGPTGVGKTELAKGLAELLFGEESRLIRFDMSEYAAAHADQRLLGAPPGYVGYEEGGKLTNAIKEQPFSVLLFDEIEKAHPSIFDKFLQILDDGRLTDGKGETVYFSESIIIFTSNLGAVARHDQEGPRQLVNPDMSYAQVQDLILQAIREHFNQVLGRPEILNRFGENFVIFDFIRPPADEEILDRLLQQLTQSLAEQQNIRLSLASEARETLLDLARQNLKHGGRGIRNILEAALINPLASALFDQGIEAGADLQVTELIDHGEGTGHRFEIRLAPSFQALED